MRYTETWSSARINSRASIVHNNLPLRINSVSEPILFADDNDVIISSRNLEDFCSVSNFVLSHMVKWSAANNLVLNLDKINIMKFITINSTHSALHTSYEGMANTKFLGLQIDNHLNWKNYTKQIIPKLHGACYAIRSMVHISNINNQK